MKDTIFEDPFSEEVWKSTYKDYNDNTIDDTIRRVANYISTAEETKEKQREWAKKFYDMLSGFKITAGGRIYSNAGTEWSTTLHNCFVGKRVKHDPDSLEGIYEHLLSQSLTLKSEGGWGENFSYIRPRGAFIHGIGVETPGSVKYMELFDKASDIITAGSGKKSANKKAKGKIRKGAMMACLDVTHPDIIEFITAKQQPGRLTKFNISVNCTDEFMNKVINVLELKKEMESMELEGSNGNLKILQSEFEEMDKWNLRFPDTRFEKYKEEWNGNLKEWEEKKYPVNVYRTVSVLWLWNLILESTYNRAEPGVLFLDRANSFNPFYYGETIVSTNPCGEQMLSSSNICTLGSINLTQFINEDRSGFDLDKLSYYTRILVRFLDNVNTLSKAPLPEYEYMMRHRRRIGCGILGWASALYMLKVRFGSSQANEYRDEVMSTIAREAYKASIDLAEEKGMFTECIPEKHVEGRFIKSLDLPTDYIQKLLKTGIRNSSLLSIQPTGNTSIFSNIVSGGLEPVFMHEYVRTVIVNSMPEHIQDVTPKWYEGEWRETSMFKYVMEGDEEILKGVDKNGVVYKIDKNRGLTKEVLCEDYGVRWLKRIHEWDPSAEWAATTNDLDVDDHVNDLCGFAKWIDSSISKTTNIPYDYSFEDFKNIYLDAYNSGVVKGVTTYRAGTMTSVLSVKNDKLADYIDEEIVMEDVKLPNQLPAMMNIMKGDGKKWYLTTIMNEQRTRPVAFFVHTNHHEKTVTTHDAIERLMNLAKEKGIPARWIYETFDKMEKDSNATKIARAISLNLRHGVLIKNVVSALDKVDNVFVGSFLFQIRKYLSSFIKDGEKSENEKCSVCGNETVIYREGCKTCISCGNSKCG